MFHTHILIDFCSATHQPQCRALELWQWPQKMKRIRWVRVCSRAFILTYHNSHTHTQMSKSHLEKCENETREQNAQQRANKSIARKYLH